MSINKINIEFTNGIHIETAIKRSLEIADIGQCDVEFIFNGLLLKINRNVNPDDVLKNYYLDIKISH
jgi:hypothetical protein